MNGEKVVVNSIEIDTEKAQRLLARIVIKEKNNIKTKKYNEVEMAKQIKKMIEEEVECY